MSDKVTDALDPSSTDVCMSILAMLQRFKMQISSLAEEHNLTPIQLGALRAIRDDNCTTMGQLATALHCDASNATGIIDRLTTIGLVSRQENIHDRRVKTLELTDQGSRILSKVSAQLPARLGCDVLTVSEKNELYRIVGKLAR